MREYVIDILTHKANPVVYEKQIENAGTKKQKNIWTKKYLNWDQVNPPTGLLDWSDSDSDNEVALLDMNNDYIMENADQIIDAVVNKLIRSGHHTVEFVMSNNQVRGAYKRYLTSILIRNAKPPPPSNPPPALPQEELDQEEDLS